jgi:hypothetical protein
MMFAVAYSTASYTAVLLPMGFSILGQLFNCRFAMFQLSKLPIVLLPSSTTALASYFITWLIWLFGSASICCFGFVLVWSSILCLSSNFAHYHTLGYRTLFGYFGLSLICFALIHHHTISSHSFLSVLVVRYCLAFSHSF